MDGKRRKNRAEKVRHLPIRHSLYLTVPQARYLLNAHASSWVFRPPA